jgi:hypothetical protein
MTLSNQQILAKNLLLKSTLYKTLAWAFILFLPASKLYDCSPNYNLIMTLGNICDMNSLVVLIISAIVFYLAHSSHKKAMILLSTD